MSETPEQEYTRLTIDHLVDGIQRSKAMTKTEQTAAKLFDGKMEAIVGDEFANRRTTIMLHDREVLGLTGKLAVRLVEHFGIVAAKFDGTETTKGEMRLVQQDPAEVVERAVTTAELLVAKLRERGHIATVPSLVDTFGIDEK